MVEYRVGDRCVLLRPEFGQLLRALEECHYEIVGPTVRDGAIVYDRISKVEDLPVGWTDRQDGGKYRLERRTDSALFGYNVGPYSWKRFLFPPRERLWTARQDGESFSVEPEPVAGGPLAFFGMRACELAALEVTDKVFQGGPVADPAYHGRRARILKVAVQCGQAGGTCFLT